MQNNPHIPASSIVPELTFKAVLLGAFFAVVMGTANVYLGLKVGMTVSASIPSAVLSMLVLRAFRRRTILENNAVQTAASAGESLAAGCIFTLPALLVLNQWEEVHYIDTVIILILGGLLGVIFSVPLRKFFIVKERLSFPEGVATSEILLAGEKRDAKDSGVSAILGGALIASVIKFSEACFGLWKDVFQAAAVLPIGKGWLLYFGSYLSPALVGVGYIIGPNVSISVLIGGLVSWVVVLPWVVSNVDKIFALELTEIAYDIWNEEIRYLGVGAMVVGGLWTLISLRKAVMTSVRESLSAYREKKTVETSRLEKRSSL